MKSNLFRLTLFAVLGAFALNTAVAEGTESNYVNTGYIAVSYADLNLASPEGLDTLYRRIKSAAHQVCGVGNQRVSLEVMLRNQACVAGAMNGAISKVNNTRLTHLHEVRLAESRQS
jgi:UrcA family protein